MGRSSRRDAVVIAFGKLGVKQALILVALLGCAPRTSAPNPLIPESPAAPAPLSVKTVVQRSSGGFLDVDSPFFVVLSRPVGFLPPDALELDDESGRPIEGETKWLDRQVVGFYPRSPLARGKELHLELVHPLRAQDGSSIAPRELSTGTTPLIEAKAYVPPGGIHPVGAIRLSFENDIPPIAEVALLSQLSDEQGPVPFVAEREGAIVTIASKTGFRPGARLTFGWKSGMVAKTSLGRIHLKPVEVSVLSGLTLAVGEKEDHCRRDRPNQDERWVCASDEAHVVFSAPIAPSELQRHAHPQLSSAFHGDRRGHRIEVEIVGFAGKPITVSFDADLKDIFGQPLGRETTLVIRRGD